MSATLGGLIKDLRLQKNISQLEIAFALGWKEPSRLSRIEQGRVGNPPRELIDRLSEAMKLTNEERNSLLLAGSYLPTNEDFNETVDKLSPIIDTWPYPAALKDFAWRSLYLNSKLCSVYEIPIKQKRFFEENMLSAIEVVFYFIQVSSSI